MNNAVTTARMREIDRAATQQFGIPSSVLMENAGRGVAQLVLRDFPKSAFVGVVCGTGNNGGDGFVIARYLAEASWTVTILLAGSPDKIKGDALENYLKTKALKIPIKIYAGAFDSVSALSVFKQASVLVDALFGTGLNRPVEEPADSLIEVMNRSGVPIYAVDVPSGLDSDQGVAQGVSVRATLTATLGRSKIGLYLGKGPKYAGRIELVDIGLPKALLG